eukprot:gene16788-18483_t
MYHLPRCASILSDEVDAKTFFDSLSSLDVKKSEDLRPFLEKYKGVRFSVSGISEKIMITGNDPSDVANFEQFALDLWKDYYTQEDVYQLAILEDKSPVEGLFIGLNSGKVFTCAQADDFSQQKVVCIGDNLYNFIWVGPTPPIELHSGSCLLNGCYGCIEPVIRDRVFGIKHHH